MPAPGDVVDLTIEKPAAGGRMIARLDGQVLLVAGVIPGERVRARVETKRGGVLFATVTDVLEASADRRAAGDDPACGGRHFAHIVPARQLAIKTEILRDAFRRIAHLDLPTGLTTHASPEDGYRMRARLHVQGSTLGFYREGSHALCDPGASRQLLPATLEVVAAVSSVLAAGGVSDGRSLELSENRAATERALFLDLSTMARGTVALDGLLDLAGVTGMGIARGGEPISASGSPIVTDTLELAGSGGQSVMLRLGRHVSGFFQGNRFLLQTLAERVLAQLPEGPMADLYAGAGLFGLAHAALGRGDVVAVEDAPGCIDDLQANAAPYLERVRVMAEPVEQVLHRRETVRDRAIVLDPPRTGLSRDAMAALTQARPSHIVYVSCDVATLARDAAVFSAANYEIVSGEIFDLFPGTAHVEAMVSMIHRG